MLHQVNCRIMVVLQVKTRVIRFYFRAMIFFIFHRLHFKRRLIPLLLSRCGSSRSDIGRRSFNRHGHFTLFGSRSFILWRTSQVEHYFMGIFFVIFFTGFFQVPGELFLLYTRKLFGLRRLFLPSHRPRVRKLLRCFTWLFLLFLLTFQKTKAKQVTQPDNRTCTQINEEANGSNQQYHPHPRHPHLRHQPIADIISMHTAQIKERVLILVNEHEAKEHREPNQQQRTSDKPLP